MLSSAPGCRSNSMAPISSFEGKSLKKKMTWMVENRNQKHEESILIILRNRKQLTSLVSSLSPFALDFKGRQSQNFSASGLRLSSSSTHWTLSNHSPVGPFSWTHRISTLLCGPGLPSRPKKLNVGSLLSLWAPEPQFPSYQRHCDYPWSDSLGWHPLLWHRLPASMPIISESWKRA